MESNIFLSNQNLILIIFSVFFIVYFCALALFSTIIQLFYLQVLVLCIRFAFVLFFSQKST